MSRRGLGPNLSMRRPRGRVVALSRKEPMVKPRLSISSWDTQLAHMPEEPFRYTTVSLPSKRDRDREREEIEIEKEEKGGKEGGKERR